MRENFQFWSFAHLISCEKSAKEWRGLVRKVVGWYWTGVELYKLSITMKFKSNSILYWLNCNSLHVCLMIDLSKRWTSDLAESPRLQFFPLTESVGVTRNLFRLLREVWPQPRLSVNPPSSELVGVGVFLCLGNAFTRAISSGVRWQQRVELSFAFFHINKEWQFCL